MTDSAVAFRLSPSAVDLEATQVRTDSGFTKDVFLAPAAKQSGKSFGGSEDFTRI